MLLVYLFVLTQSIIGYRLKSYNLNKYSSSQYQHDCLHTTRSNISISKEVTICYRHKPISTHAETWSKVFFGQISDSWEEVKKGFDFSIWPSGPWVGLRDNGTTTWVGLGEGNGFDLLTWRHSCIAISFSEGQALLYENGELQFEDKFEEFVEWGGGESVIGNIVSVGCAYGLYQDSDVGLVTDFQIFSRILSREELEDWTGCRAREYGDIVNWELESWTLNTTENNSEMEYLEFERNVCYTKEYSLHVFPLSSTFKKSLKLCEKVSGKLFQ